jgi:hypothetical protein
MFIFFILIFSNLSSQNIWEVRLDLNGTPEESVINKLEVVDTNNIYFISNRGIPNYLYKSINQGKNWELIKYFYESGLSSSRDIKVFDSLIYISFYGGIILKSTDYGKTFEKIDIGYNNFIDDLIMFDENNGIANMPLKVYKTTDGWKSFDTIQLPFKLNSHVIKKYDDSIAYGILSNFGKEFEESNEPNNLKLYQRQYFKYNILNDEFITTNFPDMTYSQIEFASDSVFYLCGKKNGISGGSGHDAVFKSTDAGKTWRTILDLYADWNKIPNINNHKKPSPFGLQDIAFKNDSVGIAVGQFGKIVYTYDGGESWIYEQKLPHLIDSLTPPTMLVTYVGDKAIIGDFTGAIHTLKEDNLAPKPEDTLTISGKIDSEDSLAITCIPIRLNNNRITMTDKYGNYRFTKLSPGTYTVTALNKYFDGENPSYYYEPYLYSPTHSFELTSDTSGIDFESLIRLDEHYVWGSIYLNDNALHGITIKLENVEEGKDTLETISGNFYSIDNIPSGTYTIRPISDKYTFEPPFITLRFYIHKSYDNINFTASPLTSVRISPNYTILDNILYSKYVAGCFYRVIDLQGNVIKSSNLSPTIDFNYLDSGTYILHVTKNNSVVFSEKFQVVR